MSVIKAASCFIIYCRQHCNTFDGAWSVSVEKKIKKRKINWSENITHFQVRITIYIWIELCISDTMLYVCYVVCTQSSSIPISNNTVDFPLVSIDAICSCLFWQMKKRTINSPCDLQPPCQAHLSTFLWRSCVQTLRLADWRDQCT